MEVKIAAIADFASLSREGKLNIMGVFSQVNPPCLPFQLPQMFLVIGLAATAAEADADRKVTIVLMDEDGNRLFSIDGGVKVGRPAHPGALAEANQIVGLANLRFQKAGVYQFCILVDGDQKGEVVFRVNEPLSEKKEATK